MTGVERERDRLRKQFDEAFYRCRDDPTEGVSFNEEEMMAAIQRSMGVFKSKRESILLDEEPASAEEGAAPADVKAIEEPDEEEAMFMVDDVVCSSLLFLICRLALCSCNSKCTCRIARKIRCLKLLSND